MSKNKIWIVDGQEVIIADSARKHGISDENIIYLLEHYTDYIVLEEFPTKLLFFGFDCASRELELITVDRVDNIMKVIHAMKLRKSTAKFIQEVKYGR